MKSNFWLFGGLAWLAAASAVAQDAATNSKPPAVSRLLTGPLARDVVLDPPATATVRIGTLLVRTQPAFAGDILTHVVEGQTLTVLEQIALAKPKLNEPTNWARITLPTNAPAWVFADYINTNSMTVSARRVNVRGGAGDNYGIVALLEKGAPVKQVRRTADWIQIVPPTNAYGFVASDYLTLQPPPAPSPALIAAAAGTPPSPPVAPEPVAPPPPAPVPPDAITAAPEPVAPPPTGPGAPEGIAAAPVPAPPVAPEPVAPPAMLTTTDTTNIPSAPVPPPPIIAPEPVATTPPAPVIPAEAAPPPAPIAAATVAATTAATPAAAAPDVASIDVKARVVVREGYVRKALNIQAPADFELRDANSGSVIEYLQPNVPQKDFKNFTGQRVLVSGTEWLDQRWPKTPILRIQTIDLIP